MITLNEDTIFIKQNLFINAAVYTSRMNKNQPMFTAQMQCTVATIIDGINISTANQKQTYGFNILLPNSIM